MKKVVYNSCYGGFALSQKAADLIFDMLNEDEKSKINKDLGCLNYQLMDVLERHDERLVHVVEKLGKEASGSCSNLQIEEIYGVMYRIDEYDGAESVETPDSTDLVVIK